MEATLITIYVIGIIITSFMGFLFNRSSFHWGSILTILFWPIFVGIAIIVGIIVKIFGGKPKV